MSSFPLVLIVCVCVTISKAEVGHSKQLFGTAVFGANTGCIADPSPVRESAEALRNWRSARLSPSIISVMDTRYIQLGLALDGYKKSEVPLVAYRDDCFVPAGYGDDMGIFYFVPLIATKLNTSVAQSIDLFLGSVILLGFTAGFAGVFCCFERYKSRIVAITGLTIVLLLTLIYGDVYVAQSSLVVAAVPWLLCLLRKPSLDFRSFCLIFAIGGSAGLINFIRIHAGTAVVGFAVILTFALREKMARKLALFTVLLLSFIVTREACNLLIVRRDAYLQSHDQTYRPGGQHVVWHTIYAGLGFLQNDYGLKYEDATAAEKAFSMNQNVLYLTPAYDRILRNAVISFTFAHPKFVAGTLVTKFGILLFVLFACANRGLIAAIRHPKPWPVDIAFVSSMAFTALPSMLAVPRPSYMLGYMSFAVFYGAASIDYASAALSHALDK